MLPHVKKCWTLWLFSKVEKFQKWPKFQEKRDVRLYKQTLRFHTLNCSELAAATVSGGATRELN